MHHRTTLPTSAPLAPPCLPGCTTPHRLSDGFWPCSVPVGSVTVPGQRAGESATVTVEVLRDVDLDGSLHQHGVQVSGCGDVGVLSAAAARQYAWLLWAAADRDGG